MAILKYISGISCLAAIIVFGLSGCRPTDTRLPSYGKTIGDAPFTIVLVHGLKGAFLQDPSEDRPCWLSVSVALGFGNCNLALPTHWRANQQHRDDNRSTGLFDKLVIIPKLVEIDFYGDFIQAMEKQGAKVQPFYYDWRRDNLESRAELENFLVTLIQTSGMKPVVVAHSMGGMIALSLYNRAPDLFEAVVLVGATLGGNVGFLEDVHIGVKVGLNSQVLSPKVYSTFPSQFSFFPLDGSGLVNRNGQPLAMDFYATEDWQRQKLGRFSYPEMPDKYYGIFLKKTLKRAKEFRQSLKVPSHQQRAKFLVVIGRGRKTIATVMKEGPSSIRGWDIETPKKADGDGRVKAVNAKPEGALQYEIYDSTFDHTELLQDPRLQKRILRLTSSEKILE